MTVKTVERAIYELLKGFAGGRVTALRARQNETRPFIVFQSVGESRIRSINGPSGIAQSEIQIDVYADDFFAAKDLAAQIEDLLDGYSGTVAYGSNSPRDTVTIGGISMQSGQDLLDQTAHPFLNRNIANYLVTYQQ